MADESGGTGSGLRHLRRASAAECESNRSIARRERPCSSRSRAQNRARPRQTPRTCEGVTSARGVHAAATHDCQEPQNVSNASPPRTLKRTEVRAPCAPPRMNFATKSVASRVASPSGMPSRRKSFVFMFALCAVNCGGSKLLNLARCACGHLSRQAAGVIPAEEFKRAVLGCSSTTLPRTPRQTPRR